MERITDWALLWQQLVDVSGAFPPKAPGSHREADHWQTKAQEFEQHNKRLANVPGPTRDFLVSRIAANSTVLDIGAGTGRWTAPLAARARHVTALDPSPAMLEILTRHVQSENLANVTVVQGSWPEADVAPHDISLCSHAMYGSRDLPTFIRRMIDVTRRTCYLNLRMPARNSVMAAAATRVFGQPQDSPNFVVGYNVLLQMGLCPSVLVDPVLWDPWTSPSLEAALAKAKSRLGLGAGPTEHDAYLLDLLSRRLTAHDGKYVWPKGIHSALVYWDVG